MEKVLVVGCGGIGCELIKCLVLSGITNLTIVDLDIIETSNLNRQFFFNKTDVGKSKALVCKNKIEEMFFYIKNKNITSFCRDIFSKEFDVDFFGSFALVINALDNKTARSHVNKMCVACDVPLIDSGTAGYLGQVHVMKGGVTNCYDCNNNNRSEKNRTYPICTIRNTPTKLIHCIVWAKHVYNCVFDSEIESQFEVEDGEDDDFGIPHLNKNEKTVNESIFWYLNKLLNLDINNLILMEDLWKNRTKPESIAADAIKTEIDSNKELNKTTFVKHYNNHEHSKEVKTWMKLLICSFENLINRFETKISWEKDDLDIMAFTASLSNIRALQFSIEPDNIFNIKSMAGSIIPAIATTNAIAAALSVAEALKLLDGMRKSKDFNKILENNLSSYILKDPNHKDQYLINCKLEEKNEDCVVCGHKKQVVELDYKKTKIVDFLVYLNKHFSISSPDIYEENTGRLLISSEEDDKKTLLEKCTYLSDVNIDESNAFIRVEDFDSEEIVSLILKNKPGRKLKNSKVDRSLSRKRSKRVQIEKIEKNEKNENPQKNEKTEIINCDSDSDDVVAV